MSKYDYSVEQLVSHCECLFCPPCGFLVQNNEYTVKKDGSQYGTIKEDATCLCRMICPPCCRNYESTIDFESKSYTSVKTWKLGYCIVCCPGMRPDIQLKQGANIVGYIQMPCMPACLCKFELNCYSGAEADPANLQFKIRACALNGHTCCGPDFGCCMDCARYMPLQVTDGSGNEKGSFRKVYNGLYNECCTVADKYEFSFPIDNELSKALFLAAVQFFDMLYFETYFKGV